MEDGDEGAPFHRRALGVSHGDVRRAGHVLAVSLRGYSLRKPIMNEAVELTSKAAHVAKRSVCYPDMCYIDAKRRLKVDIEHHGKFDHSIDDDWDSDRARVNGLKEMGFEVIELTNSQVKDLETFEIIIQRIAKLIGKQVRKEHCGATPARLEFRRAVIEWNRSYGRLS